MLHATVVGNASFSLCSEGSDREKDKQMSRLTLPLKFGQHSEKDASWQAAALRYEDLCFAKADNSPVLTSLPDRSHS